jgi:methionine-rich copper-binding protein CopC
VLSEARAGGSRPGAVCAIAAALLMLSAVGVGAHAFVSRSEPRTGATVVESPARVRIWFDGPIERLFATIAVEDKNRRRVDKGSARVNANDDRLLEVELPPLPPGRYRVSWSVVARDGHTREGDFSFLLK